MLKFLQLVNIFGPVNKILPVDRYVDKNEFIEPKSIGLEIGFSVVESGSLVRSSSMLMNKRATV